MKQISKFFSKVQLAFPHEECVLRLHYDPVGLAIEIEWRDGCTIARIFTKVEIEQASSPEIIEDIFIEWIKSHRAVWLRTGSVG